MIRNLFLFSALLLAALPSMAETGSPYPAFRQAEVKNRSGRTVDFFLDLAVTPEEQALGLMNCKSMPDDIGMLFLFPEEDEKAFWMKDTLIPLDMLFIATDGTIRHIHEMAKPEDLSTIPSEFPIRAVLEINGGLAGRLGISEGDTILNKQYGTWDFDPASLPSSDLHKRSGDCGP